MNCPASAAVDTVAVVFPHSPPSAPADPAPGDAEGAAADAIRAAEAALARQNSVAAQVDLQVVTAVLNAHTTHGGGVAALRSLQREIESAVVTRTDLDSPAGARSFQHYLIDKLHDIRTVVETAGLDDSSKAALAAALSSLYATSATAQDPPGPAAADSGAPEDPGPVAAEPGRAVPAAPEAAEWLPPVDVGLDDWPADPLPEPEPWPAQAPAPAAAPAPPLAPPAGPAWGAGMPAGAGPPAQSGPLLPGLGSLGSPGPLGADLPLGPPASPVPEPAGPETLGPDGERDGEDPGGADPDRDAEPAGDPSAVLLPSGEVVTAASPALAAAIGAALEGTPIPEAFAAHGITIPPPGSPVPAPLDPGRLSVGDIGLFADRYAVALGDGQALLDGGIVGIDTVGGPGFLGWLRPPDPEPAGPPAESPPPAAVG